MSVGFAASAQNHASIFVGKQVSDGWQDIFTDPHDLDWRHSGVVGVAMGHEWHLAGPLKLGFEAQVAQHFGEQDHTEFNLPVTLKLSTEPLRPLRSLGFGIGPSFATEVPPIEVETRGGSEQLLLYWMIEAEFASPSPAATIYGRLHHRSNGFGTVAENGGSNVLVIGVRHYW